MDLCRPSVKFVPVFKLQLVVYYTQNITAKKTVLQLQTFLDFSLFLVSMQFVLNRTIYFLSAFNRAKTVSRRLLSGKGNAIFSVHS
jgi:hypothetical protein